MKARPLRALVLPSLLLFWCGRAVAEFPPVVLDDFETGKLTDAWTAKNLSAQKVNVARDDTLSGGHAFELKAETVGDGYVQRPVSAHDWRRFGTLSFHAAVQAAEPVELRVQLLEGRGPRGFQRRVTLNPGGWREVLLPLADFRWNTDQVGDFSRIDRVAVRWMRTPGVVLLDDLRLLPGGRGEGSARPALDDWLRLAFPAGGGEAFESEHFEILTDVRELQTQDAKKLLSRLEEALQVLRQRYGIGGELPEKIPLNVFRSRSAYRGFFQRLGDRYQVTITLPLSDGYSVLETCASYYDPRQGWDRPVFVHEAMHPTICYLLRLPTNNNWVQEALAAGVQAALFPKSMSRDTVATELAKLASNRQGAFLPWSELFAHQRRQVDPHAELVTVMDFFQDQHRSQLPKIWEAIRNLDKPIHEAAMPTIAATLKQDVKDLEKAWLAWATQHYAK